MSFQRFSLVGIVSFGRLNVMSLAVEGKLAVVRAFANANEVQEMSQIFASWDSVTLSESQGGSRFFFWFHDFLREKDIAKQQRNGEIRQLQGGWCRVLSRFV